MTEQNCTHGQLYVIVPVEIAVAIDHNSAIEVSKAKENVTKMIDEAFDVCMNMPASYYNVGDKLPIRERTSLEHSPFKD